MVLLHSARTANATLASAPLRLSFRRRFAVRSAHSARTLALLVRSPARPGRARGLCGVAIAPLSARSQGSHAGICFVCFYSHPKDWHGSYIVSLTLQNHIWINYIKVIKI